MKRYNNLFEKIIHIDNIRLAHKNASKGKKHYKAVQKVEENSEEHCMKLHNLLKSKEFTTSSYDVEVINDKGKERVIHKLPYFPDRILHHAVMQVLDPIWRKTFINDTYQSIKGRGIYKCKKKIDILLRKYPETLYCLKIDIKKFYPSVDTTIMKEIVRKKIKCKDTLWLLDDIIDSSEGLPIGNYISQHLGNLYLTYIDHKMKEVVKCKYYYRYCDDIVVIDEDKKFLHHAKEVLFNEINVLNLSVKGNYQIFKIDDNRPLDFLGYKFYRNRTLLRDTIATNFRKCKKKRSVLMAYFGWLKHSNSHNLWKKYFKPKE